MKRKFECAILNTQKTCGRNSMKVAIAGNIILDLVKRIDVYPQKGMLANICGVSRSAGGCVCNTAIDLKRLDTSLNVSAYGRIGKDEYGEFVLEFMRREGIDVSAVVKDARFSTSFTDVMTVQSTGERTFFQSRGANAEFLPQDVNAEALDCELFHLGYLLLLDGMDGADEEYGTRAARLLHDVQSRGIRTGIDLVSEQSDRFASVVVPALRYCDYVVINEIEGGRLAALSPRDKNGAPDLKILEHICRRIKSFGVKKEVVLHCPELSCGIDKSGAFFILPSLQLPEGYIVGSVGAGDAFCAGMIYSFLKNMTLEEGMRLASCMAAKNLSVSDSVSGAKPLEETLKIEKTFKRRNLQC